MRKLFFVYCFFLTLISCKETNQEIKINSDKIDVQNIRTPCECIDALNAVYKEIIVLNNQFRILQYKGGFDRVALDSEEYKELLHKAQFIRNKMNSMDTDLIINCPKFNETMNNELIAHYGAPYPYNYR